MPSGKHINIPQVIEVVEPMVSGVVVTMEIMAYLIMMHF